MSSYVIYVLWSTSVWPRFSSRVAIYLTFGRFYIYIYLSNINAHKWDKTSTWFSFRKWEMKNKKRIQIRVNFCQQRYQTLPRVHGNVQNGLFSVVITGRISYFHTTEPEKSISSHNWNYTRSVFQVILCCIMYIVPLYEHYK